VIFWGIVIFALSGCTPVSPADGDYKIRIPLDDHTGHYALQDVDLHTITDIHAMAGTTAVIYDEGSFNTYVDNSGDERIASADMGTTPSAHFIDVGGVLHPADFQSLAMSAAMYHFEYIKNFYDAVDGNKGLTFPRIVLMNVTVAHNYGHQQVNTINNAAFVPSLDMFWINPFNSADVPLSFNGGVLAHEYLHNVFMARFKAVSAENIKKGTMSPEVSLNLNRTLDVAEADDWGPATDPFADSQYPSDPETPIALTNKELAKVNSFIFGGLNEGMADYFGYEYSRNPGWISASLPTQSFRDLSKDKIFPLTAGGQQRLIMESYSGQGRNSGSGLDIHWLGSFFSRVLYLAAQDWGDLAAEQATITFMDRYSNIYSQQSDKRYISMGELVKLFFQDRKPSGSLCDNVTRMFSGELAGGSLGCGATLFSTGSPP